MEEIDALNILRASHLAMQRAVAALARVPEMILVDGNLSPEFGIPAVAVIGGDDRVGAISAASILAKVARDREMAALAVDGPFSAGPERMRAAGRRGIPQVVAPGGRRPTMRSARRAPAWLGLSARTCR